MEEKKQTFERVPPTELAKLVAEIGVKDTARETGYTSGHIHEMIRNGARPVVENWARLYRMETTPDEDPDKNEIVICRVSKAQAQMLTDYVTKLLGGKCARFVDR